jgi:hypothetical protein
VGEPLVRIHPGDDEQGVALVHGPLDEGVLRFQVEDVELVDPGRHDQQRPPPHLGRRRRVLDQLHQVVLEDDLAGRRRHVLAEPEGPLVRHRDREPAAAALQVGDQMLETAHQVLAAAVERLAQHLRIRGDEVGGRPGIDQLARVELDRWVSASRSSTCHGGHPARVQEIACFT